jgi:hypothetical protein
VEFLELYSMNYRYKHQLSILYLLSFQLHSLKLPIWVESGNGSVV